MPWYYEPPFPAASDNDRALKYWQGWLDRGYHVGVTGGSDNHWVSTTSLQGAGQPTTWVFVRERSVAGILEGLREGRTFVSHEPPAYAGQRVYLEADRDNDGRFESMVGDTVPASAGVVTVVARVLNAQAHSLRFVVDGHERPAKRILALDQTVELKVNAARFNRVRAEAYLDQGYWMGAITSPIYFGG